MALLNASELSPEAQREADLDAAYSGNVAPVQGFKPVRRVTAMVVDLLRRANNFFITGARGFKAMDIDPKKFRAILMPTIDGIANPDFDPSKAGAVVPKIAEVIALLTCSDDDMDKCDDDISNLHKLRRRIMSEKTSAEVMKAMGDVQAEFTKINRSSAIVEDEPGPPGAASEPKKKRDRASERATS